MKTIAHRWQHVCRLILFLFSIQLKSRYNFEFFFRFHIQIFSIKIYDLCFYRFFCAVKSLNDQKKIDQPFISGKREKKTTKNNEPFFPVDFGHCCCCCKQEQPVRRTDVGLALNEMIVIVFIFLFFLLYNDFHLVVCYTFKYHKNQGVGFRYIIA